MRVGRRDFLRSTAMASVGLMVPRIVQASTLFGPRGNGRCAVIIQLNGGNDWLNTAPPIGNDLYYKARPTLGLRPDTVIRITPEQGLHPELKGLGSLFDQGQLSIVNSVGYDSPVRSHFRSMDIWQSASDADRYLSTGWVGRTLDEMPGRMPYQALEFDESLSLVLKGTSTKGIALASPEALYSHAQKPLVQALSADPHRHQHPEVDYLYRTLAEVTSSADHIYSHHRIFRSHRSYPSGAFGRGMQTIAELIISGCGTLVYYISLDGFDTHSGQEGRQKRLLRVFDDAVAAFMADMKDNNRAHDVAVLTFSEFGRRVEQNASGGTDHGAAGNVLLMGGSLRRPGIVNSAPDLLNLDDGDIRHKVDFRRIYADLIGPWLGQRPEAVLGSGHEPLGLL